MCLERITRAYHAEHLAGSYFTTPLRTYNSWFQDKIRERSWQNTAWKVCCVASAIVAYLLFGPFALIGSALNFFLIPPSKKNHSLVLSSHNNNSVSHSDNYSPYARLIGIPQKTEKFFSKLNSDFSALEFGSSQKAILSKVGYSGLPTDRCYSKQHKLVFDVQDAFEDSKTAVILEDEDGKPISHKARWKKLKENHILDIKNIISGLSQHYNWAPEEYDITRPDNRMKVVISVPDEIAFLDHNRLLQFASRPLIGTSFEIGAAS